MPNASPAPWYCWDRCCRFWFSASRSSPPSVSAGCRSSEIAVFVVEPPRQEVPHCLRFRHVVSICILFDAVFDVLVDAGLDPWLSHILPSHTRCMTAHLRFLFTETDVSNRKLHARLTSSGRAGGGTHPPPKTDVMLQATSRCSSECDNSVLSRSPRSRFGQPGSLP